MSYGISRFLASFGRAAHILPAAQPSLCLLLLLAGRASEAVAPRVAVVAYILAYVAGGAGSAAASWLALRRLRVDVHLLMILAALGAASLNEWPEGGVLLFLFSLSNALDTTPSTTVA